MPARARACVRVCVRVWESVQACMGVWERAGLQGKNRVGSEARGQ